MVEYNCLLCSFKTTFTTNYNKHLKSKKHLANEKKQKDLQIEMSTKCQPNVNQCQPNVNQCQPYHCSFCNKQFNTRQAKSKHQKKCNFDPNVNQMSTKNVTPMLPIVTPMLPQCYPKTIMILFKKKMNVLFALKHLHQDMVNQDI